MSSDSLGPQVVGEITGTSSGGEIRSTPAELTEVSDPNTPARTPATWNEATFKANVADIASKAAWRVAISALAGVHRALVRDVRLTPVSTASRVPTARLEFTIAGAPRAVDKASTAAGDLIRAWGKSSADMANMHNALVRSALEAR